MFTLPSSGKPLMKNAIAAYLWRRGSGGDGLELHFSIPVIDWELEEASFNYLFTLKLQEGEQCFYWKRDKKEGLVSSPFMIL